MTFTPAQLLGHNRTMKRIVTDAVAVALFVVVGACGTTGAQGSGALRNPEKLTEQAPPRFRAAFDTSKGRFVMDVHREWAPIGVDRFYNLVKNRFFDEVRFFRVIAGGLVQFGMHGDPAVQGAWRNAAVKDDPVKHGNVRGTVSFANRGRDTRTTQLFINLRDNSFYDQLGFAPFAEVVSGLEIVDSLFSGYAQEPDQVFIDAEGNAYLAREFPKLDYVKKTEVVSDWTGESSTSVR